MKRHIPNLLTLSNLFCGCIAIIQAFNGNWVNASLFIFAGAVFDFFDGFAARLLNVKSDIGKQLDSLADLITFGVAPATIAYVMMQYTFTQWEVYHPAFKAYPVLLQFIPYSAYLIAIFSALRLAKFNIDTRQEVYFIGLPTPANAMFWAAFPLINYSISEHYMWEWFEESQSSIIYTNYAMYPWFYVILVIAMSLLLVSPFRMFSFKFKNVTMKEHGSLLGFLILSILLLITLQFIAVPILIFGYILLSILTLNGKKTKTLM